MPDKRRTRRSFGALRQLPSKRYQASYLGPDGLRHIAPVTFNTKGDAQKWISMQEAAILEHRWKPAPPPTPSKIEFEEYAKAWLLLRELKPRTRAEYAKTLDKLVAAFGKRRIRDITAEEVREWYRGLDPNLKAARTHAYSLLRTIMGTALTDGVIDANPVHIVGAGNAKRAKPIRPATINELATITQSMPPRYRALVLMACWTALRFGELTELRRRDLDLDEGVIHVSRAVTWPNGVAVVGTPKSAAGVRDVHIPPHIIPALRWHLEEWTVPALVEGGAYSAGS